MLKLLLPLLVTALPIETFKALKATLKKKKERKKQRKEGKGGTDQEEIIRTDGGRE